MLSLHSSTSLRAYAIGSRIVCAHCRDRNIHNTFAYIVVLAKSEAGKGRRFGVRQ